MRGRAPAALGLLLLVLAACGNAGGTGEAVRDSAGQAVAEPTTTTTAAPPEPSTTTTTAGRTTTTTQARTTTTARAGATPTTAAPGATPLTPAAPGTYYYDTSGRSTRRQHHPLPRGDHPGRRPSVRHAPAPRPQPP